MTVDLDYEPGVREDERAQEHRQAALAALDENRPAHVALVHALLALESRLEELTCYIARH